MKMKNWAQLGKSFVTEFWTGVKLVVTPENTLSLGPQFHKVDICPRNTF